MRKNFFIRLAVLIGMAISIIACDALGPSLDTVWKNAFKENMVSSSKVITLTADTWADVNSANKIDGNYWFKFIATASTQYIHGNYENVYDSSGSAVKNQTKLDLFGGDLSSLTLTAGQTYYICGQGGKIAFNTTISPPAIQLTYNTWADGNLTTSDDVQWFKFTANASYVNIHVDLGTARLESVQVYDSSGVELDYYDYRQWQVTSGQTYYIRVRPYYYSYENKYFIGTYQIGFNTSSTPPPITLPTTAIQLTANQWADGNLTTSDDVQWFKFTADTHLEDMEYWSGQYIHIELGTARNLDYQVYHSSGVRVVVFSLDNNSYSYYVTNGETYYIRVRPSGDGGTYQIAFNSSSTPPPLKLPTTAIQLTANTWANGNFTTSGDVQWYKFTANASTQYINFDPETMSSPYVQVYDSSGVPVGKDNINGPYYTSWSVTIGQTYYIKVRPNYDYRIVFTTSPFPITLPTTAIQLTANQWADSNITKEDGEQWFKFIANASAQYIHGNCDNSSGLSYKVYDSNGVVVGYSNSYYSLSSRNYSSDDSAWSVTNGQTYYIRVHSSWGGGTYQITFSSFATPPPITLPATAIQLTAATWANGNITTSNVQWFKFTANASTQYIHVSLGTMGNLYVLVYDSSGVPLGYDEYFNGTYNDPISCSVTSGQTYYLRASRLGGNTGTYRIAFNTSETPPP